MVSPNKSTGPGHARACRDGSAQLDRRKRTELESYCGPSYRFFLNLYSTPTEMPKFQLLWPPVPVVGVA